MRVAPLMLAVLLAAAPACSDGDKEEGEAAAKASCDGKLVAAKSEAALPSDLPAGVTGATFYEVQTDGATKRYFGYTTGTDVVATRDTIRNAFSAAGFEIEGSDEEAPAEAEFEWVKGSNEGSVQVIPLCQGHQRIRYRTGPK